MRRPFNMLTSFITRRMERRDLLNFGLVSFLSSLYIPYAKAATQPQQPKKKIEAPSSPVEKTLPKDVQIINFIDVSQTLTDHKVLNYETGVALYNAITRSNKQRVGQIAALHKLMTDHKLTRASSLAKVAERHNKNFKDVIHDILLGWYRGVADDRVVVYGTALMFQISRDGVFPKTYAQGESFYWKHAPPEVPAPHVLPSLSASKFVNEPT